MGSIHPTGILSCPLLWLTQVLCKYVRVEGNRYRKLNNLVTIHHCYSGQVNKIHSFVEYKISMFLGRNMIVLNIKKTIFLAFIFGGWPASQ